MIYDIKDILRPGAQYPPECEIKRRDGYRINEMLLDDDPWSALPDYTRRVNFVLSHFNIDGQKSAYYYDCVWGFARVHRRNR